MALGREGPRHGQSLRSAPESAGWCCWCLAASASYVGVWALLAPASFFRSFPGGGQAWVRTDGLYNEHLVRDVGALYLALLAVTCAGLLRPETDRARMAGVAWLLFGVPHLAYHAEHLA